jgi:hypothetical protein
MIMELAIMSVSCRLGPARRRHDQRFAGTPSTRSATCRHAIDTMTSAVIMSA